MSALTGKHILVLGLGESGLAMARWCALRGARVRVADSRALPPGRDALKADAPLAELFVGGFGDEVLDGVDLVALSPGLDPRVAPAGRGHDPDDAVGPLDLARFAHDGGRKVGQEGGEAHSQARTGSFRQPRALRAIAAIDVAV